MKSLKLLLGCITSLSGIATIILPILHKTDNKDIYITLGYIAFLVFFISLILFSVLRLHLKVKNTDLTSVDKDEIIQKLKKRKEDENEK